MSFNINCKFLARLYFEFVRHVLSPSLSCVYVSVCVCHVSISRDKLYAQCEYQHEIVLRRTFSPFALLFFGVAVVFVAVGALVNQ